MFLYREEQPAVWVSGFYGSGKSHLVKMLDRAPAPGGHIWAGRGWGILAEVELDLVAGFVLRLC